MFPHPLLEKGVRVSSITERPDFAYCFYHFLNRLTITTELIRYVLKELLEYNYLSTC
jgi:hypothetical protein